MTLAGRLAYLITLTAAFIFVAPVVGHRLAHSHDWYSGKLDPVFKSSCCGGTDCATWLIQPGEISTEDAGIRVRLSLDRTKTINPYSVNPVDALVIWDRVQPSEDGNWHLCIMTKHRDNERGGIYCLFRPPET